MRETIQQKLEEIQDIEITPEIPDEMIEEGKTYFSFTLQETYIDSDLNNNYTYQPSIIGFVKRKKINTENTLEIVDIKSKEICSKLKELNFKSSYKDVSVLDHIQKNMITSRSLYNEINNKLV